MLKARYLTGSSLLLTNTRDIDEVWFYESKEECDEARRTRQLNEEINVHYDYVGHARVFLGCYSYHYMKLIEGDNLHLDEFDIFEEETKKQYIELLKKYTTWLPRDNKKWYHILTAVYIYKYGKYDLTDAQLTAIQRTHDKGITDSKYNFCIETLNELS